MYYSGDKRKTEMLYYFNMKCESCNKTFIPGDENVPEVLKC